MRILTVDTRKRNEERDTVRLENKRNKVAMFNAAYHGGGHGLVEYGYSGNTLTPQPVA